MQTLLVNETAKVKGRKSFTDMDQPESAPILGLLGNKGNIFSLLYFFFFLHSFGLRISGVSQRLTVLSQSVSSSSSSTQTVSASPDGRASACEPAAEWKDPRDLISTSESIQTHNALQMQLASCIRLGPTESLQWPSAGIYVTANVILSRDENRNRDRRWIWASRRDRCLCAPVCDGHRS